MKTFVYKLLILFFLSSSLCQAHEVRPGYLEIIQQSEDSYAVMWKVPAKGGQRRLALDVVFADDVETINKPVEAFSGGSYIKRWKIRRVQGLVDTRIFIEGLQSTFVDVLVRIEQSNGNVQMARLLPDDPSLIVQASPSTLQVAKTYTNLGIKHILTGVDHLLFLVCLLIIAGTSKRILITITGFTLAHSVTLVLSALDLVQLSIAPVEAIIALSIVFVATEIAKGRRETLTWKYPLSVSSSFGLLHGFGFAAVLSEIGLPQTERATGLLFFNVGVEIGQLIFVVLAILLMRLVLFFLSGVQPILWQRPVAYGIGTLASFWLFERSMVFL